MNRLHFVPVAIALAMGPLFVLACGDDNPQPNTAANKTVSSPMPTPTPMPTPMPTPSDTTPPPPPPPPPATISDMGPSADPKPMPNAAIAAPTMEMAFTDSAKAKDYQCKINVKNWDLGKDGAHVHVIIDGHPYFKLKDAKVQPKLGEVWGEGDIPEGQHYMIAFPSRGTHESVKGKGASSIITFWVGKKGKATIDLKKPMLVYSRPKGQNLGAMGKDVLVDFYLNGTMMDPKMGEKVHYDLTGPGIDGSMSGDFMQWAPKVVHGLQKGDFTLKLQLNDKDGKAEGDAASRTFSVDGDAPDDPSMGMPAMTMGASSAMPMGSMSAMPMGSMSAMPMGSSSKPMGASTTMPMGSSSKPMGASTTMPMGSSTSAKKP